MDLFVYLERKAFVTTWVAGGTLPIRLASAYLALESRGSLTTDETYNFMSFGGDPRQVIRRSGMPLGATYTNCLFVGPQTTVVQSYRRDNGLVLCFSTSVDHAIATRFSPYRPFCVGVRDFGALKAEIDRQVGAVSQAGPCRYVPGNSERSPFVKGLGDAWQSEYRLYWPDRTKDISVVLPAGLCEEVCSFIPRSRLAACPCGSGQRYKHCHGSSGF